MNQMEIGELLKHLNVSDSDVTVSIERGEPSEEQTAQDALTAVEEQLKVLAQEKLRLQTASNLERETLAAAVTPNEATEQAVIANTLPAYVSEKKTLASIENPKYIKVLVGFPCNWEANHVQVTNSLVAMMQHSPLITDFFPVMDWTLEKMRNRLAERALQGGYSHLLMLDADMIYPKDCVSRLLADNKPIVQGLAVRRTPIKARKRVKTPDGKDAIQIIDFHPPLFSKHDETSDNPYRMSWQVNIPKTGTHQVDAVGMGGTLIRTDVLAAMTPPYFVFADYEGEEVGEDIRFSIEARKLGFTCWVNCDVLLPHLITMAMVWENNGVAFKYTFQGGKREGGQ